MIKRFIIAIDLGGTNLKCALLDSQLRIVAKKSFNTKNFNNKAKLINGIANSINSFILEQGLTKNVILGVGIGLPGPVDPALGLVHFLPNIPGWREVGLKKILELKTKLSVFIDNDAKLMTLAEHTVGAAKGYANALCLTLGTGVGGGLILNQQLYRGFDNAAGELGHIPLNENGPACGCGGKACLEKYVGNNVILKEAYRLFGKTITLEKLSGLAKNKNSKAIKFWSNVGKKLGLGLTGIVNLLNLDVIIIGGGVAQAGKVLFASVRQTISKRAMSVQSKRIKIFRAKLGNDAGLIGAGLLVKEKLIK